MSFAIYLIDKNLKICYNKLSRNKKKGGRKMEIDNNAHSVFLLKYVLILTTKNRKDVFDKMVSERAEEIFKKIACNYHITEESWTFSPDYICVRFKAHPKTELSKFINAYKSASSRLLKKEFPSLNGKLYQNQFWSQSFGLFTEGSNVAEMTDMYLKNQKAK